MQETINVALNEDQEELEAITAEKQPNVYIENPEAISKEAVIQENTTKARLKSARRMSAAKRPQSGARKY